MSLKTKQNHEDHGSNRVRDCSRGQSINKNVCNFNDIQYFDGESHKEEFIDCMLDLVDYFSYAKVFEHFKVFFVSRILESDVANWWNDIQYFRRRR